MNAKDRITFTVAAATYGTSQAAIIFTCSTPSEFAAQPAVVTVISTTGISSTDATASTAATYSSVTAMTAIDGDVDETTVALTPSKIVLKATPTTEITASGTITFTAGGTQSAIWVTGQAPVCTGTKNNGVAIAAIADADLTSSTTTTSITITISNNAATAGHALVFTCVGHLAANVGTSNTATTFTATSTHDVQQVAFGAGYVTSEPQQGALAIAVTQVSAVGTDGTKPVSIVYTWTPDASTVLAPTTITVTHTGATPWDGATATCAKSGSNAATLTTSAVSDSGVALTKDRITFTVAAATSGAGQAAIVFTCSTPSEFAAQPAAVTTISATGVSSVDVTPSVAATYNSVTKMTAIDGDVDETTIGLTPSKIVLKATTTMAISNSGTITFTAGGSQSAIWTSGQTPTCTGTEASSAITTALISSTTSTSSITITIHSSETIAANTALVFTCSGDLAANHGTAATATTFTATSTSDTQQVAFGAGYVTTAAKQGALGIVVTQVSTVGADGTKPVSIVYTWTPDTSTVLVPTTITLTHTGATPWNANGAVTCTKSGTNARQRWLLEPRSYPTAVPA